MAHNRISYHLSSARTVYQLLQFSADGKTEEIKEMLDTGVNVNAVDYDKRSALHLAAAEGRSDTVKFLVERGGNVNAVDRFGGTPLRDALEGRRYDISSYLRLHGGTLGERSDFLVQKVCHAASEGNVLMLENVFENSFLSIDAADYDNRTPLHLAAACNHKKACEYLLKKGANPRTLDRFGNTAIEESLREGHPELSQFLEEFDPEKKAGAEEEDEEDSSSEEEVEDDEVEDDLTEEEQFTPKEKCFQSAVVIFIQSFFSHVLEQTAEEEQQEQHDHHDHHNHHHCHNYHHSDEEESEDDFHFDLLPPSSPPLILPPKRTHHYSPASTLSHHPHLFKDFYHQFRNKFHANRSPNPHLDTSLRRKISLLSVYEQTTLNYLLLFNEQCVKTNFFDEEKGEIFFHFAPNFLLSKEEEVVSLTSGANLQLQFQFS